MCLEHNKYCIKTTFSLKHRKNIKNTTKKHPKSMKNRTQKPPTQSFEKTTQKKNIKNNETCRKKGPQRGPLATPRWANEPPASHQNAEIPKNGVLARVPCMSFFLFLKKRKNRQKCSRAHGSTILGRRCDACAEKNGSPPPRHMPPRPLPRASQATPRPHFK